MDTNTEKLRLVTLPEAAQMLSVSKRTLERQIAGGAFPSPMKIGRSVRVSLADISAYLLRLEQRRGCAQGGA